MAARLNGTIAIHILIEGRPGLTKRLWDRFPRDRQPLVLTSRIGSSPVYIAARARDEASETAEPAVLQLMGTMLLPDMDGLYRKEAELARRLLVRAVDLARKRFGLRDGEPVRIAVAGSQGSLWTREHAQISMPGSLVVEDGLGGRGGAALTALRLSARDRSYVAALDAALAELEARARIEIHWLAEVFPDLRPRNPCENRALLDLAAEARQALVPGEGAVPLLYVRHGNDPWRRYVPSPDPSTGGDESNPVPFRTTMRLIQQYHDDPQRGGLECVLVRLVPKGGLRANRCDNPIVTTAELQQARDAGIAAVLLDAQLGVTDLVDETEQGVIDDPITWQREQLIGLVRESGLHVAELARVRKHLTANARAAAEALEAWLARVDELEEVLAVKSEGDPVGVRHPVSLPRYAPFRRLRNFFRRFTPWESQLPPRADLAAGDHSADRPADLGSLSNRQLVREIHDAVMMIVDTLRSGTLAGPFNAAAARPIVASIGKDLTIMLAMVNEWQRRADVEDHEERLIRGRFHRVIRRIRTLLHVPSAHRFFRVVEAHAAHERRIALDHAAIARLLDERSRSAELAAYPGRPDYPPIYRV